MQAVKGTEPGALVAAVERGVTAVILGRVRVSSSYSSGNRDGTAYLLGRTVCSVTYWPLTGTSCGRNDKLQHAVPLADQASANHVTSLVSSMQRVQSVNSGENINQNMLKMSKVSHCLQKHASDILLRKDALVKKEMASHALSMHRYIWTAPPS